MPRTVASPCGGGAILIALLASACASTKELPPRSCALVDQLVMRASVERRSAQNEAHRAAQLWYRRSTASDPNERQAEERDFRRDARDADERARTHMLTAERYDGEAATLAAQLRAEGTVCPR